MRDSAMKKAVESESLTAQTLKAVSDSLRQLANLVDALATANATGSSSDMLKPSDVQRLINCGESKARQIVRAHGIGHGKMGRIERGVLMDLQRRGEL